MPRRNDVPPVGIHTLTYVKRGKNLIKNAAAQRSRAMYFVWHILAVIKHSRMRDVGARVRGKDKRQTIRNAPTTRPQYNAHSNTKCERGAKWQWQSESAAIQFPFELTFMGACKKYHVFVVVLVVKNYLLFFFSHDLPHASAWIYQSIRAQNLKPPKSTKQHNGTTQKCKEKKRNSIFALIT